MSTAMRVWIYPALVFSAVLTASCGVPASGAGAAQASAAARPADLFRYTSDYGDYIGLGQSKSFAPPSARFVVEPGTQPDYVYLVVQRADEDWSIDIAAPTGQTLQVGTYDNAAAPSFRTDKAGVLMVYGDGRGCDRYQGTFTIKQILFDQQGHLLALQSSFIQRCKETAPAAFHGTLNYGRTGP